MTAEQMDADGLKRVPTDTRLMRSPHVAATTMEGGAQGGDRSLLDLRTGKYYTFNGVTARVIEIFADTTPSDSGAPGRTVDEVLTTIQQEYELPPEAPPGLMEREVSHLIVQLIAAGLVVPAPATADTVRQPIGGSQPEVRESQRNAPRAQQVQA